MNQDTDRLPLGSIASFEALVRTGSVKAAASERNVTTAAIYHQMRQLERRLSLTLFQRRTAKLELTDAGREVASRIGVAFDEIESGCNSIRLNTRDDDIVIGVVAVIANYWLAPKLARFQAEFPEQGFRLVYIESGDETDE